MTNIRQLGFTILFFHSFSRFFPAGNGSFFPASQRQVGHFPRFPAGNSKLRKCATLLGAFECYKIGSAANLHLMELNYSISQPQGRACGIIQANVCMASNEL